MKPIITHTDYNILQTAIKHLAPNHRTKEMALLMEELSRVEIVKDTEITSDVIRIDSYFEVAEDQSDQILKFKLVLPEEANISEKKISVLSTLGIALIGYKEGMLIDCALPAGNKELRIIKVVN